MITGSFYHLYCTQIRDDESVSMQLLLGYIGLFNAVLLSPVLIALVCTTAPFSYSFVRSRFNAALSRLQYFMGLANLTHLTGAIFGFIVLNGFCDNVFSDYLWARAVVLTSPTVATIGMSITIPLAMASDYLLGRAAPTGVSLLGAFLVVSGFVLVNIPRDMQDDIVRVISAAVWPVDGRAEMISRATVAAKESAGEQQDRRFKEYSGYSPIHTAAYSDDIE